MRTTLDIDDPVLRKLKKLQIKEGKSLGRIVSDLLARALKEDVASFTSTAPPVWVAKPMGPRVNLSDKEAVHSALGQRARPRCTGSSRLTLDVQTMPFTPSS